MTFYIHLSIILLKESGTFGKEEVSSFNSIPTAYISVFVEAEIPERYGYKLLSGEKRTRQRDVILRICFAAGFSLIETQKALKKYRMPELYAKIPRDALIMIAFNERVGSISDINKLLEQNQLPPLKTSGTKE